MRLRAVTYWVFGGILGLAAGELCPQARATTFFERPFEASVKDAPVIVHGVVGNTYTDWGHERDGARRIYTFWEFKVSEVLKGDAENGMLRMREMGGEKDGRGLQVSGAASFDTGEEVVVFLDEKNSEGSYDVYGMSMGKYSLRKEADGEETLSGAGINNLTRSRLGDGDDHGVATPKPRWTIDGLRRLLASQGVKPAPAPAPVITPTAVAAEPTLDAPASEPAASGLQLPDTEEPTFPWFWVATAVSAAMIVALLIFKRK